MGGAIPLLAVPHFIRDLHRLQSLEPVDGSQCAQQVVYVAAQSLGVHPEPLHIAVHLHAPANRAQPARPRRLGEGVPHPRVSPQGGREVHLDLGHALQALESGACACRQGLLLVVGAAQRGGLEAPVLVHGEAGAGVGRVAGVVGADVLHLGEEVRNVEGLLAEHEGVPEPRVVGLHLVAVVVHLGGHLLGALERAGESVVLGREVFHLLLEVLVLHLVVDVLVVEQLGALATEEAVDELLHAVAVLERVDEGYLLLAGLALWELRLCGGRGERGGGMGRRVSSDHGIGQMEQTCGRAGGNIEGKWGRTR